MCDFPIKYSDVGCCRNLPLLGWIMRLSGSILLLRWFATCVYVVLFWSCSILVTFLSHLRICTGFLHCILALARKCVPLQDSWGVPRRDGMLCHVGVGSALPRLVEWGCAKFTIAWCEAGTYQNGWPYNNDQQWPYIHIYRVPYLSWPYNILQ